MHASVEYPHGNQPNLNLGKTGQSILDVLLVQVLVVPVPAAERGTALGDVARGPHHAKLVDLRARLVVGHEDVELALADLVQLSGGQSASAGAWWARSGRVKWGARSE